MTELHRTEVDGVATVWVESPGALSAGLLFRTGRADETLVTLGRTHLLEHLVLSTIGEVAPGQNGEVGGVVTGFHATGAPEVVAAFLTGVTRSLGAFAGERLDDEKQVLEAETARRPPDLGASLLNWRYGATGYGLLWMQELGLKNVTIEHLSTLAAARFTRQNAFLWLSGPPPAGLHLDLPEGVRQPLPRLVPIRDESPSWYVDDAIGGVAIGSTGPRNSTATVFRAVAGKLLRDRLRAKQAVSYAPQVLYEPLDADTAHVVLYADSEPDRRAELTHEFVEEFEVLGRISKAQLEDARREALNHLVGPLAPPPDQLALVEANRAALDWIFGREFEPLDSLAAGVATVSLTDLQTYARGLRQEALFALPSGALLRQSMGQRTPTFRGGPVKGRTVSPVDGPYQRERLVYGPEGVTLRLEGDAHHTIHYQDVAAALRSEDGRLVIINTAADAIIIEPNLWRNGARAIEEIRARIPKKLIIEEGARRSDHIPEPATTRWERLQYHLLNPWLVLATCFAVGMAIGVPAEVPYVSTLFLIAGLAAFFQLRKRRRMAPRPRASAPTRPARKTPPSLGALFTRARREWPRGHRGVDGAGADTADVVEGIMDTSSFSIVAFRGDHGASMPDLLSACGYSQEREWKARGNPAGLSDAFHALAGRDDTVTLKAYWSSPEVTVLIDPEVVISSGLEEQLTAFCAHQGTSATVVMWERVSETAILTEMAGTGVVRRTWYQQGRPFDSQKDPRPELKKSPDARGLRAALAACGLPVGRLFADTDVTVLELRYVAEQTPADASV